MDPRQIEAEVNARREGMQEVGEGFPILERNDTDHTRFQMNVGEYDCAVLIQALEREQTRLFRAQGTRDESGWDEVALDLESVEYLLAEVKRVGP